MSWKTKEMKKQAIAVNPKRDIANQKFSKLLALRPYEKAVSGTRWECLCDCGKITYATYSDLTGGRHKSCGCSQYDVHRKAYGRAAANKVLGQYKRGAKDRNLGFNITDKKFFDLTKRPCFYCGCEPSSVYSNEAFNGDYTYNGVDRIDNTKGYDIENVVPCCGICNMMKKIMSQEDFINKCKEVAKKHA
ncbi:MAG: hypothetical protein ACXAC5_01275 [Promethearchaeota archaeon]|jgi:hypothetical protein